jgi:hypothetical protein
MILLGSRGAETAKSRSSESKIPIRSSASLTAIASASDVELELFPCVCQSCSNELHPLSSNASAPSLHHAVGDPLIARTCAVRTTTAISIQIGFGVRSWMC